MAPGRTRKMPNLGQTLLPQPGVKRRLSQLGQDAEDNVSRKAKKTLTSDFIVNGSSTGVNAYSDDSRNVALPGSKRASISKSGNDDHEQDLEIADSADEIIEISDDSSVDLDLESDHEMLDTDGAGNGLSDVSAAAAPTGREPAGRCGRVATRAPSKRAAALAAPACFDSMAESTGKIVSRPAPKTVGDEKLSKNPEYHLALSKLAKTIPSEILGGERVAKKGIWRAALRYIDQLHGITSRRKDAREISNYTQKRLAEYVQDDCDFIPRKSELFTDAQNLAILARALAAYFEKRNKKSSKKATTKAQKSSAERGSTLDADDAATARDDLVTASNYQVESADHDEASRYIRELSISLPPGVTQYYEKNYEPGDFFINDLPIGGTTGRDVDAIEASAEAEIKQEPEEQLDHNPTPPNGNQQPSTVSAPVADKAFGEPAPKVKAEEAEDDTRPAALKKSVEALQGAIREAVKSKIDWSYLPRAMVETDIYIKRVTNKLNDLREAVAEHGY